MTHGQQAARQFHGARTGVEMAEITLQGRDGDGFRHLPQGRVISPRFGQIIALGSLAVGVDMPQIFRGELRLP